MSARIAGALLCALLSVSVSAHAQSGAWIVTLGNDTTAVEQYTRAGNAITGDLVTRGGGTVVAHYVLALSPNGAPAKLDITYARPDGSRPPNFLRSVSATYTADSATVMIMRDTAVTRHFAVKGAQPIIGGLAVSMGLYEAMFAHLRANATTDSIAVMVIAPTMVQTPQTPQWVKFFGPDSARIWAFGFATDVRVDRAGHVFGLSGRNSTQKIEARRVTTLDLPALARGFAASDATNRASISASVRDSVRATIGGATIAVDYFRPTARGRNVFSNGVLGDTIWRTGANNATEFKTDRDLVVAGQMIPAGTYTLWTHAPANNSRYELIFNKQTKIWGTAYNSANDFVRVPLAVSRRATPIEAFQISVENPGLIRLSWASTDLTVPFSVKP